MKKTPRIASGFTLIEILLALAIGAAAVLIASQGFLLIFKTSDRQKASLEVSEGAQDILLSLGNAVREAESVLLPLEGASGGSLILEYASTSITFTTDEGVLWRTEGSEPPIRLSGEGVVVAGLLVKRSPGNTAPIIDLDLTLASVKTAPENTPYSTETFHTSVLLRAH